MIPENFSKQYFFIFINDEFEILPENSQYSLYDHQVYHYIIDDNDDYVFKLFDSILFASFVPIKGYVLKVYRTLSSLKNRNIRDVEVTKLVRLYNYDAFSKNLDKNVVIDYVCLAYNITLLNSFNGMMDVFISFNNSYFQLIYYTQSTGVKFILHTSSELYECLFLNSCQNEYGNDHNFISQVYDRFNINCFTLNNTTKNTFKLSLAAKCVLIKLIDLYKVLILIFFYTIFYYYKF